MEHLLITDAEITILQKLYERWQKDSASNRKHDNLKAMEISYTICSVLPRLLEQIKILLEYHAKTTNQ